MQAGSVEHADARLTEAIDDPGAVSAGEATYIFGGSTSGVTETFTDTIWRFDPAVDTVETMDATLPSPRRDVGAAWTGERVYLFGGYGCTPDTQGVRACDQILRYDPANDTIETLDVQLPARDTPLAVWTGEHVYLVGEREPDVHRFDPETGELTTYADVLGGWRDEASAVWDGSGIIIFPGADHEIVRFDPADGQTEPTGHHLPGPREAAGAVWTGQTAYVFAGDDTEGSTLDEIVRYDPATGEATVQPVHLPGAGDARMPAVWNGSTVHLIAYDSEAAYSDRIVRYDPSNVAPEANFTIDAENRTVALNASASTDPDGEITTYTWSLGDGTQASGASVEHAYDEAGTYEVELTVEDDAGALSSTSDQLTIANHPPEPVIETRVENYTVHVSAMGSSDPDGDITTYTWSFGDGVQAAGPEANHTYDGRGDYTLELNLTDDEGATATNATQVEITNHAPIPRIDLTVEDMTVHVSARNASDPDGEITTYTWSFGDGASADGRSASHTYSEHGNHTITLTASDDDGASATARAAAPVLNQPPRPTLDLSRDGMWVTADARGSSDPDGRVVGYRFDWGDGSTSHEGPEATHRYRLEGTHRVVVTAIDDDGDEARANGTIEVARKASDPVAAIEATVKGLAVQLDASSSHDPDGEITSYRWTIGEGAQATGAQVEHTFDSNGTYLVELNVTDDDGRWDTATRALQVSRAHPDTSEETNLTFVADAASLRVYTHIPADHAIHTADGVTYTWRWGDGSEPTDGPDGAHTYDEAGRYTINLTASLPDGATRSAEKTVLVGTSGASLASQGSNAGASPGAADENGSSPAPAATGETEGLHGSPPVGLVGTPVAVGLAGWAARARAREPRS